MANLSQAQIIGIVSLIAVLTGSVIVTNIGSSFYCQPENNVKECIRLSLTNTTCYLATGSDQCTGGKWQPLSKFLPKKSETSPAGSFVTRDPEGKCYDKGDLNRGVKC